MADFPNDASGKAPAHIRETGITIALTSTGVHRHPTALMHTGIPILKAALNVEYMGELLRPLLQPLAQPGMAPRLNYARLVAFKYGNRGLVRYDISVSKDEHLPVFGKIYPETQRATRAYNIMDHLHNKIFAGHPLLRVPRPLGDLPQLSMLVYIPATGKLLSEVLLDEYAEHYVRLAGTWLGRLHQSKLPLDREFRLDAEMVNVQKWAELIAESYPAERQIAHTIAAWLVEQSRILPFDTAIPIHKDFHYGHILVDGGLNVIDFDEFRLGDGNFDLAHFCVNLHLLGYRAKQAPYIFSALQRTFLDAYAQQTGWSADERFVYFYAYTCLKLAKQICCQRGPRPRPVGEEQYQQAKLMLSQGLAALPPGGKTGLAGKFATLALRLTEPLIKPPEEAR